MTDEELMDFSRSLASNIAKESARIMQWTYRTKARRIGNILLRSLSIGVDLQVLSSSPNRVLVGFFNIAASAIFLSNVPMGAVSNGLSTINSGYPIILDVEKWGSLVQGPWHAICGSNVTLVIVEVIDTEFPTKASRQDGYFND